MRVVVDTDVLVAAVQSDIGASRVLLRAILRSDIHLLLSVPLMLEYEAVLKRRQIMERSGISADDVDFLLDRLAAVCCPVSFRFRWRPLTHDPNDDMVLETAVNGAVLAIASFNLRHLAHPAAEFGILAMRPVDLLKWLPR